jgi:hypothetical protein
VSSLKPETIIEHAGNAVTREIGGQLIVLAPAHGTVHELDELGCFIWGLCSEPISVEAITARIVSEYEVDSVVAEKDLVMFLDQLIEAGVMVKQ